MNSNKESDCLNIIYGCSLCWLTLILIAGCFSYIVFGIIYLIEDYDIAHDCNNSSLWAYVLTSVIISFLRLGNKKKRKQ